MRKWTGQWRSLKTICIITGHTGNPVTADSNMHFQKANDLSALRMQSDEYKIVTVCSSHRSNTNDKCTVKTEQEWCVFQPSPFCNVTYLSEDNTN